VSLTIGSLFSGIGGLELGLEWAGLGPVLWQVEMDPFCRRVLEKHWPGVERYADVRSIRASQLRPVDLICGGFPCQDVSASGKGAGLSGAQSGLWYEFWRIAKEARPRFLVIENVRSGASRWLCQVRTHLHQLGYQTEALGIAARDVGAPQRRARVFVVAHSPRQRRGRLVRSHVETTKEDRQAPSRRSAPVGGCWSTEPSMGRVAYGVPCRMDQLRALGNAVVPQQAEVVGEVICQMLGQQ